MAKDKSEAAAPLVEGTKPFSLFLGQLEGGAFHDDLSDDLRALNEKLAEFAAQNGLAKGSLVLKFTFKLDRDGVLEVNTDVATKAPKLSRARSVMWLTPGNNITHENPKQISMFGPRKVAQPEEPARTVPEDTPAPARKVE
jgi:hypothetical protein